MTRVDRREFSVLAQSGGRIHVDQLPPPVLRQLESAGVSQDTLREIAGDDSVIEGAEFNQLYNALAVRADGRGGRVDGAVSEDLFRTLSARVEHQPEATIGDLSNGSARGRTTGLGSANVDESAAIRGRTDGQRPNWFVRALESVAEFFVELFSSRDYITSGERDYDVGRRMAQEHPETLRAILAVPGGEALLRDRLIAQRPHETSERDWNHTIDDVMRGMRATLTSGAADLPDNVNPNASLSIRDRAAILYAQNADPAARTELSATVDALGASGLSERAQLDALSRWNEAGRPAAVRTHLQRFTTGLETMSPAVRREAIAQLQAHPERLERLSSLVSAPGFQNTLATDADRLALLRLPNPTQAVRNLETLFANPGFARLSTELKASVVRQAFDPNTTPAQFAQLNTRLQGALPARLAPLNEVLFGDRTLAAGARGPEVLTSQRYLRALGYDGILGINETDTFGASTTAAVTEFQRRNHLLDGNPPAARAGVLDRPTMIAMTDQLRARGIDPAGYRFTTDLSLNRPTRTTDGPWRATQRWTPALQQEFSEFAIAYTNARIPKNPDGSARRPLWDERVDCADLSYEALIQFARQRGLPIHLSSSGQTFTNRSSGPIVGNVQSSFGAMHLNQFTRPIGRGEAPRPGDLGNMQWAQSQNGHDSHYWHSHNIVAFDPLYREASVIYGSLDDLIKQPPLDAFNTRGFNMTIHDIPEVSIIDAINDDSGQNRGQPRAEQERRVRALLERHRAGGHQVTDEDVGAFIRMVENGSNIHRDAPTAVSAVDGEFSDLVDGDPWADPAARTAAVADLNARFGANFTEADIDRLVNAGSRVAVDRAAAALVEQRVPAGRREGAQAALTASARGTVRYNADRDALSDRGLRTEALRGFNATYGSRVRDTDLSDVLRAGNSTDALAAATRIVEQRGVPVDRRAEAAGALVDAADSTRRFRRWDFDMFNRHM